MKRIYPLRKKHRKIRSEILAFGASIVIALALSACTEVGDFDRPTISIRETESILGASTDGDAYEEQRFSDYSLTYKEERMRTIGYRLIQPLGFQPRYRDQITAARYTRAIAAERPLSDGDRYYESLRDNHRRYEDALWNKLISDIQNDEISALRFVTTAEKVLQQDAERIATVNSRTTTLPDEKEMFTRIEENTWFIELVTNSLADRMRAYRYAIERAKLEAPSDKVFDAQSRIADLDFQYQQITQVSGDGYGSRHTRVASNAAYHVIEPPIIDLSSD